MAHLTIYDLETLLTEIRKGFQPKFLFFWGHHPPKAGKFGKHCLSQWWSAQFEVEGQVYPSAEHYMMAEKARLFGDHEVRDKILTTPHPGAAKALGRQVVGFDEQVWAQHRFDIVVRGNVAKFGQNDDLKKFLLSTKARVLVEASPRDWIWGIGLSENEPRITNPEQWQGLNLLGFALMKVRTELSV